ncbi:hypothetical protein [Hwanghaeella sp.]|uniref:hypothetical protein n=1 Tax=Hwanghaeella sp. TaxID=2605943 RepID=UPI003CCBBD1B
MSDQESGNLGSVPDAGNPNPGNPNAGNPNAAPAAPTPGDLSIGKVFSLTFSTLFRHFHLFFLLAAVTWLPGIVLVLALPSFQADMMAGVMNPLGIGIYVVISWLLVAWLYGSVTHMACVILANGEISIGASIKEGLIRAIPVFFILVLQGIAVAAGFVFLIIPGFIVMVMLAIAVPAGVAERKGPLAALSRSAALTKGYRSSIFGVGVLAVLLLIATGIGFGLAAGTLPFTLSGEFNAVVPGTVAIIIGTLFEAVQYLFLLILAAVLYHQIRVAKEGSTAEEIAAVFD